MRILSLGAYTAPRHAQQSCNRVTTPASYCTHANVTALTTSSSIDIMLVDSR